jgi:tripartite-type tricarboxylate transporter receptor subunit TctC
MFDLAVSSVEQIKAGKLRALGVTTATRIASLQDVPPIGDFVPGYEASGWIGFSAPKDTPVEIIHKLNTEINAAVDDRTMRARLADLGALPFATSPPEFGQFIVEFTEKWAEIIRAAGIKA